MNYVPISNDKKIYPTPCVIKLLDFCQSQRYLIAFIGFSPFIYEIGYIFIFRIFCISFYVNFLCLFLISDLEN